MHKASHSKHTTTTMTDSPLSSPSTEKPPAPIPPSAPKSSFKHFFTFTPPSHLPLLALSFVTAAIVAAGRTLYAVLLGKIFDVVSRFGAGLLSPDVFLAEIARWSVWMCVLGVGIWVTSTVDVSAWVVGGELRAKEVRGTVFATLAGRRMGWLEQWGGEGVGAAVVRVLSQTRELQTATSQTLGYFICDVFVFGACMVVAFVYSYKLTLVMLATGVPSGLILWGISRFLDPAIEAQRRELAQAAKHVTAATTAIDLVKVYNGADHEAFQFISAIRRSAKYYTRQILCNCGQMGYIKLWMAMLFVLGFYVAIILVGRNELTPGDALTAIYGTLIAFRAIEALGPHWLVLAKGMAAGQFLQALVRDGEDEPMDTTNSWMKPLRCGGDIRMTNVSFAYPSNPTNIVLKPSTLRFEPGQLTFVVGRSGSGKSTLGNLLVRFYEPLTGRITVDGHSITTLDLDWLRRNVTLIQQSSILFNDTLFRNVALGSPNPDDVESDAVRQACGMALLQSAISGMPDGLDTKIGPGGYNLSGGQKQRLALARAKLRDPPVLILDEITSGLDPVGGALIMEAIRIWRKGKTTIIITHKVGHIDDDDYVYVLADGSVVQQGLRRDVSKDESGLFASFVACADDGSTSRATDDTDSDSDLFYDEPLHESQYAKIIRGAFIENRAMSVGLFRQISIKVAPSSTNPALHKFVEGRASHRSIHRSVSRKAGVARSGATKLGRTPSIRAVAQRGLDVQRSRTPNARNAVKQDLEAQRSPSLESLDRFFLESLAKRKDREKPSKGHQLPSLTAILKTVWPTLDKSGRGQLVFGLFLCLVSAATNPLFSVFFANLLGEFWLVGTPQASPVKWAGLLAVVAVVDASATVFGYYLMGRAAQKWVNTLRAEAIKRILSQPRLWFDKVSHSPGRITQCLDRNAEEMGKIVEMFVPILLTAASMMLGALIWALVIRWDLALIMLAGLPVAFVIVQTNSFFSGKWEAICDEAAAATGVIFSETFSNIKVVRALTLERYFSTRHSQSASAAYCLGVKRAGFIGFFYGLQQSVVYYLTALVFYYGSKILSDGHLTVTDALRVINLLLFSLGTAMAMVANVPQIAASKATAVQMLYYASLSHTSSHEAHGSTRFKTPLPIRMTNLQFAYPSAPQTLVLRNITLTFPAASCTAIIGASGCGKSTIASLLLRLYDPLQHPAPHIPPLTYATYPSSTLHTPSLRTHLGYVPQTPFLFPATVRANLLYGLHESSPLRDDSNLHLAARQAHIHDFVVSLPQGYDTLVGEGGMAVSGGQAQRLCIARALVRRPAVLVMDEPTSALDAEAAEGVRRVVRGLVEKGEGMAVVVVTHSNEMMRVAGRVVMVEGGVVVEEGAYGELVARGGRFAGLVGGGKGKGEKGGKGKGTGGKVARRERSREATLRRLEGDEGKVEEMEEVEEAEEI
ncbi:P-loop containing nucleoside triphosphate hydrolase protein [Staphylotrichum tortipilum]|uniref:P-loop containing nucleoside triphosphate hydrolase protein n=1 Tax=Staphylotrichum tortipilum TaxID=2831512 RepID=A0AAN6MK63_9PEZI|nr:P-loop containing nucleoside triphosphate hydrolase protein [Staphylotrichum longicolle]